jgi:glycosyltransferase involved in cell wall biosynthesis
LFGTVSVLRSWKGHLYLLEAFQRLVEKGWEVFLLIVGDGPYRPVIEEKVLDLELSQQVRLVGHQDRVPEYLALMDAVVLASYANEGVPQALLQALAMAKPVVATNTGGIPEVVVPGETGLLVPPRDPRALAQAMFRLLQDATLREDLGRWGRKLATARYSLAQMTDAVEEVYEDIMGTGPVPAASHPVPGPKGAL